MGINAYICSFIYSCLLFIIYVCRCSRILVTNYSHHLFFLLHPRLFLKYIRSVTVICPYFNFSCYGCLVISRACTTERVSKETCPSVFILCNRFIQLVLVMYYPCSQIMHYHIMPEFIKTLYN